MMASVNEWFLFLKKKSPFSVIVRLAKNLSKDNIE